MKSQNRKLIFNMILSALFAAITAVSSGIAIYLPSGIPLTLQTFAVALCGYTLGFKWGLSSTFVYLLCGAIGLPVFSHFTGGIQAFWGPNGGFLLGFIFLSFFCGLASPRKKPSFNILIGLLGLLICHILGILVFSAVYKTRPTAAFVAVSLPFLLKDIISVVLALKLSNWIEKAILRLKL